MTLRCAAVLMAAHLAWADEARAGDPAIEVGASVLGLSVTGYGGQTTTFVGIPATLYASIFITPKVVLEPQVGFHSMAAGRHRDHLLIGTLQVGYLLRGAALGSFSAHADVTAARNSYTTDETDLAVGAGVGYRLPVRGLVTRVEVKYRRYFRPGADALSVIVALGVVL